MAKFYGKIGYAVTEEIRPGVYEPKVKELPYRGDLLSNIGNRSNSGNVNDNIDVSNRVSIVADQFAYDNASSMVYIEFAGALWKITKFEIQYPRILLTVGGVYNGEQA